ncbi:MAG: formimidoylglutamase [Pseudomonadota bacterium]
MPVYHEPPQQWTGREDPEDGALAKRMYHLVADQGDRAVLGFACEAGVERNKGRLGAKEGPQALRAALSGMSAPDTDLCFTDLGDVVVDGHDLEEGQALLGHYVKGALEIYHRLVVFGGGHETAYGSYLGLSGQYTDKKIGIINLDAHLDLRNVGADGPSSGTPFSQIHALAPTEFDYLCLGVAAESNTQALFSRAKEWNVSLVHDRQLLDDPMAADRYIMAMAARCDLIYLTIDIDLLPHYQAPGVSAPAARGVPLNTVERLVDTVLSACQEQGCKLPLADLVELSPRHDRDNMTARSAAILARKLLRAPV